MKEIVLTKGYVSLVDDEDFDFLNQWKWSYIDSNGCGGYARRYVTKGGKYLRMDSIHRIVMKAVPGQIIDHINGDRLDNRKSNLRFCTTAKMPPTPRNTALTSRDSRASSRGVMFGGRLFARME